MGMGNASRRRGADTSYQRDDDVARPSTEQSTRRGMVGWYSVVSVANPFGVGGSGGGCWRLGGYGEVGVDVGA